MANPKICPCTPFPDCRVRILITNRDRITLPQKHENVNASKNSLARQAFRLIRSVSGIRFLSFFFHRNRYILIFFFFFLESNQLGIIRIIIRIPAILSPFVLYRCCLYLKRKDVIYFYFFSLSRPAVSSFVSWFIVVIHYSKRNSDLNISDKIQGRWNKIERKKRGN